MIHHIKKVHLICPLNSDLDLFRLLHVNWNCFFFLNYLNYLIHVRDYLEQEVAVLTWMGFFYHTNQTFKDDSYCTSMEKMH